jgi:hypothetical protein
MKLPGYKFGDQESESLRKSFIILNDMILEKEGDLEGQELTLLLENFFVQKNYVNYRNSFNKLNINDLIGELKDLFYSMN